MWKFGPIAAAVVALGWAQGPAVDYELKTYAGSPVLFAVDNARAAAPGVPRRQFVTIKSESRKSATGIILEQTLMHGGKTEIVAIEHVDIAIPPGEKRRFSFAVADMSVKLQSAAQSGEAAGKPVLALVAVEFTDASQWNAPTGAGAVR